MIRRRRPYRYACAMPNAAPPRALFHLAYNVTDLDTARRFYGGVLGCREGRSTDTWVDFDFFGHQLSLHLGADIVEALMIPPQKVHPVELDAGEEVDVVLAYDVGLVRPRSA